MKRKAINEPNMRDKLITAARELFSKKGFSETSVGDIIKQINTSKGSLYHHFESKEHLFIYILEEDSKSWERGFRQQIENCKNTKEKLYVLGNYSAQTKVNFPFLMISEEFMASAFTSSEINKKIKMISNNYYSIFQELIESGVKEKLIAADNNIEYLALILQNMINGIDLRAELTGINFDRQELYKKGIDTFLEGTQNKIL
ncbi:TetR/AcrR family transcriptional regulator [Neobacillus mesonae]|nr:TetR/AcrR family transcriptional regulator [Neobacillus mesonae]